MSKVLFVWLLLYFGGLVLALVHPIYPFVSYLVFYYAPPHVNWWGRFLPDMRWSLLASLVMLGSIILKGAALERLKRVRDPLFPWLVLFGLNAVVVTIWALDRARSWYWTVVILKLVLLYALIPMTVRTPAHFDLFSTTHIVGATYWGYKAWDDPKRSAGRLKDVGGPDTQNENQAAGHLLTVLPFVAVYAFSAKRRITQGLLLVCGAFIVNVFILCNSRGATVGLLAATGTAVLLAGKGRRIKLIGVGLSAVLMLLYLADSRFLSRQQTTVNARDGAAEDRMESWGAGIKVMRDFPLGGGGRAFHILSPRYIPDIVNEHQGEERSVHNTYIQAGDEWGIQGLFFFSVFIGSTFLLLRRSRKSSAGEPWYFYRFMAIELALVGTLVSGIFTSRLYGESVYWMCALAMSLHRMYVTARDEKAAATAAEAEPAAAALGVPQGLPATGTS